MEYRRLGKSGLKVSALSFGAWITFGDQVAADVADECMQKAYDAGVNFFDNAEAYADGRAEEVMGDILQKKGWRRDSFVVSSKVMFGIPPRAPNMKGLSRKHVIEACHDAMKRLKVDYLDLYFCHRPDPETPIEETVLTMNDLIRQGKVLYWGTSEWSAQQIQEAQTIARDYRVIGPTMEQPQYNMLARGRVESEYLPLFESIGLGTTIWSPLASGMLTGKYNNGIPEGTRLSQHEWLRNRLEGPDGEKLIGQLRQLGDVAGDLGCTQAQLALAWCLKNPHVSTVIMGASRASQLDDNLGAMDVLPKLTQEVMDRIEEILDNKP